MAKKVIFIYESTLDSSAAQVLKRLIDEISGNVSLCLEMPEQNIIETLVTTGNALSALVKQIRRVKNTDFNKKVEYLDEFFMVNKDRYVFNMKNVKSTKDLSSLQADKCLNNIEADQKANYDSISATLDSVKLAGSKGMKVYAIDQPYNERSSVGPLSYNPRDIYMADKLTKLYNETGGIVLFLVEHDFYPIAEMVRESGILTAEYYIRTNEKDLDSSCMPSSVKPIVIGSPDAIFEAVSLLVKEFAQFKAEESKQDHDHSVPLYTISSESTKSTPEAVSTEISSLASSLPTDINASARSSLSGTYPAPIFITKPHIVSTIALCTTMVGFAAAIKTGETSIIGKMLDLIGETFD